MTQRITAVLVAAAVLVGGVATVATSASAGGDTTAVAAKKKKKKKKKKKPPPQIAVGTYSGATSNGIPMSLTLNADRATGTMSYCSMIAPISVSGTSFSVSTSSRSPGTRSTPSGSSTRRRGRRREPCSATAATRRTRRSRCRLRSETSGRGYAPRPLRSTGAEMESGLRRSTKVARPPGPRELLASRHPLPPPIRRGPHRSATRRSCSPRCRRASPSRRRSSAATAARWERPTSPSSRPRPGRRPRSRARRSTPATGSTPWPARTRGGSASSSRRS